MKENEEISEKRRNERRVGIKREDKEGRKNAG